MKLALSWIDPVELRSRLEAVFEEPVASQFRPPKQHPRFETTQAHRTTHGAGQADLEPFPRQEGKLSQRLEALIDWLRSQARARAVFVSDDDCLALAQWSCTQDLAAAATWLATTWKSMGPRVLSSGDGAIAAELDNHAWLVLLSGTSPWGQVHLGVVIDQIAGPLTMRAMQTALASALKEE